jgi:uncharacterized membrane protein
MTKDGLKSTRARDDDAMANWIGIGAGIGVAFGVIYGNIGLGTALGAAFGAIIGGLENAATSRRRRGPKP